VPSVNGSVALFSTDGQKVLGSPLTLSNGVATGLVTLDIAHSVRLVAVTTGVPAGASGVITVNPSTPVVKVFTPPVVRAGTAFAVTVTAVDRFGNGVTGPVTLTDSDGQKLTLNPSAVKVVHGSATFGVTLTRADKLTLTASVDGVSAVSTTLTVLPAAAVSFAVIAPASASAGQAFSVTVRALDAFGNVVTGFNVPVTFVSSDGQKVQVSTPLTLSGGVGTVKVTLAKPGTVKLTALGGGLKGVSDDIVVA
jgi:hypothetical protein